jgi:hypothetical protein
MEISRVFNNVGISTLRITIYPYETQTLLKSLGIRFNKFPDGVKSSATKCFYRPYIHIFQRPEPVFSTEKAVIHTSSVSYFLLPPRDAHPNVEKG